MPATSARDAAAERGTVFGCSNGLVNNTTNFCKVRLTEFELIDPGQRGHSLAVNGCRTLPASFPAKRSS